MLDLIIHDHILQVFAAIIVLIAVFIVFNVVDRFNAALLWSRINRGIDSLSGLYNQNGAVRDIRRFTRTVRVKLTFLDKLELRYVDKPLLRRYVFFANIYIVIGFALILGFAAFIYSFKKLCFLPSAVFIGILAGGSVFVALDIVSKYNVEAIRKLLAGWVSTLNRWVDVKDDVLYILEKSVENTREPLKSYVSHCVIQIKNGFDEYEALELLGMKINSEQFRDLILNLKQTRKCHGNLKALLANLEKEFIRLEKEYARKKISTYSSRLRIYLYMAFVLVTGYFFIQNNDSVRVFYMATDLGKLILSVFLLLYFIAFIISTRITNFNY